MIKKFRDLKKLLNASEDTDIEIGLENIKNLNLDPIYILLLLKVCDYYSKEKILDEFKDIFLIDKFSNYVEILDSDDYWGSPLHFTELNWNKLHKTIKKHYPDDNDVINVFTQEFTDELSQVINNTINYEFLNEIKFNIVW